MVIDFSKRSSNSFECQTEKLGKLKILGYPPLGPKTFRTKLLRDEKQSNEQLFRNLIRHLGEKHVSTDSGADLKISAKDVKLISKSELENIAKLFVKKNEWLFKTLSYDQQEDTKLTKKNTESNIDFAIRILKRHEIEWSEKLNRTASSFKSAIEFSNAKMAPLFAQLQDNMATSGTLGSLLSSSPIQVRGILKQELDELPKITTLADKETKFQIDVTSYLDEFSKIIRSTAAVIKSLNDTTIQTAAKIAKNQKGYFQVAIASMTMILTLVGVIIAFRTSDDNTVSQRMTNTFPVVDSLKAQITKQDSNLTEMEKANQRLTARLDSLLNQMKNIELGGSITTTGQGDSVSGNRK